MLGVKSRVVALALALGAVAGALSPAAHTCRKKAPQGFSEIRGLLPGLLIEGAERISFGGVVEERLDAGAYRYLRIRTGGHELWLTTPRDFDPGSRLVQVVSFHVHGDFG